MDPVTGFERWFCATQRHALARGTDESGVLLDLVNGDVIGLNATATFVWWRALQGQSTADIGYALSEAFGIPLEVATRDTTTCLRAPLPNVEHTADLSNPYDMQWQGERVLLTFRGRVLFTWTRATGLLEMVDAEVRPEIETHLWAFAPNLLALHGQPVLHASAVAGPEGLLAFSGPSGAGKTTTARAFGKTGQWRLVCEDKLILDRDDPRYGFTEGEPSLRAWTAAAAKLLAGPEGQVETNGLHECCRGPRSRVLAVHALDVGRRLETRSIEHKAMPFERALAFLLEQGFRGSHERPHLVERLRAFGALVQSAPCLETSVPSGVVRLREAAERHSVKVTS